MFVPKLAPVTAVLASLFLLACSESADGGGGAGGGTSSAEATTASTGSTSTADASSSATSASGTGGAAGAGLVRVNEISATEDWVELFAQGGAVDLSGFTLADQESPGVPKLDEAVVFPAGTTLGEGEFLLIVGKIDAPAEGPQTTCLLDGGPETCFHAAFGISDSSGDALFVLDPEGAVVDQADYPAAAAVEGESWARVPDGSGPFQVASPTPGTSNGG